jgi:hypothetical protein
VPKKKRVVKRKHAVEVVLPSIDLSIAGAGLHLFLKADGTKLGELVVGRGSVSWWGYHAKTPRRWGLTAFAKQLEK